MEGRPADRFVLDIAVNTILRIFQHRFTVVIQLLSVHSAAGHTQWPVRVLTLWFNEKKNKAFDSKSAKSKQLTLS